MDGNVDIAVVVGAVTLVAAILFAAIRRILVKLDKLEAELQRQHDRLMKREP